MTRPGGPLTRWRVPLWLRDAGLTYHGDPARWTDATELRLVGRGQEFVSDVGEDARAMAWLMSILAVFDG